MGRNSVEYRPLAAEESGDFRPAAPPSPNKWLRILVAVCTVQAVIILACFAALLKADSKSECLEPRLLYSPAYEAVEPEIKVFTVGTSWSGGFTRWQGNSPEVDAAWQELYNNTILRIPKIQAALLPNRTSPIVGDPDGHYIAQVEVFHQLHCLNMIRMKLGGEYYNDFLYEIDDEHIGHCVDSIRQSLMCTSDLSVNVWQWNDEKKLLVGRSTQAHQCRNFEKIRDWAKENAMFGNYKPELKPPQDDLVWPNVNY